MCDLTARRVKTAGDDRVVSLSGNILNVPRATIAVRVQPRARSDALVGLRSGVLVVRVMAPPLDGRANDAVCRLLAGVLGVRRSHVVIVRGERARDKVVAIEGIDQTGAEAAVRSAIDRSSIQ